jgi:hypothetical protein
MQHLSVSRNTISYAAVLDVVVKPSGIDAGPDRIWLQEKVAEFFGGFDPIQIRFVGDTLVRLLTRVAGNGLFTVRPTPELSWPTWGLRCYKYQCADKSSSPSTRSNS